MNTIEMKQVWWVHSPMKMWVVILEKIMTCMQLQHSRCYYRLLGF